MNYDRVRETDPAAADALTAERERQNDTLAMIASENHVSEAVLQAQRSELTNKYAEGYPGARYYGGCEHADTVEQLAIDRAEDLWGADHVNVQPHSGTQANMAVYLAMLDPGDRILSLLADIAHITGLVAAGVHSSPVGVVDFVTGSTHKTIRAGRGGIVMCEDEYADSIDSSVFPGAQGGPLMHNIAGKAVGFAEALEPEFRTYAEQVVTNAETLADRLQEHGFSLVSGGTDNHLVLVDLRDSHPDTTGKQAEEALEEVGIVLNANTVPGETRSAFNPSGIRIGTPALTTRGFGERAIREVTDLIARVVDAPDDEETKAEVSVRVDKLTDEFPLYG